jgi:hypothetical protein
MGGFIHILLVIAVIAVLFRLISGRKLVWTNEKTLLQFHHLAMESGSCLASHAESFTIWRFRLQDGTEGGSHYHNLAPKAMLMAFVSWTKAETPNEVDLGSHGSGMVHNEGQREESYEHTEAERQLEWDRRQIEAAICRADGRWSTV